MKRWFISDHNKILGEMEERNERERSGGSKKNGEKWKRRRLCFNKLKSKDGATD